MRDIGLDVHRDFCEVALVEAGEVRSAGRIETTPEAVELFAQSLGRDDPVVLEVTGNAWEVARIIEIPIAALSEDIRVEPGFLHRDRSYPTEAWIYEGNVVWGVTARLVRLFLGALAAAGLAPAPAPTASPWPDDPPASA